MSTHRQPRSPQRPVIPPTRSLIVSPDRVSEKPLHYESPSKYDIDFYRRKVNRLEGELNSQQDELNLLRFRLTKAEDFQFKYEALLKQNQQLVLENEQFAKQISSKIRDYEEARGRVQELELTLHGKQNEIESLKNELQSARKRQDQLIEKSSHNNESDRIKAEQHLTRQIEQLKSTHKDNQKKLEQQIQSLKQQIVQRIANEQSNASRLNKIKSDKDSEIKNLRDNVKSLQQEVTSLRQSCNQKVSSVRETNQNEAEDRNRQLVTINETSKNLLMKEIDHLKQAIGVKNQQISQLLESENKVARQYDAIVQELQEEIKHLQDKIFQIHRDHELELFNTIEKLKYEHGQNVIRAKQEFKRIERQYEDRVADLNDQIRKHKEEKGILEGSLRSAEETTHKVSQDRQNIVSQLSQKILQMESMKDEEVRNLTTSMRLIEDEAEIKLKDLHDAMLNKNSQFEIMTKQIQLKNTEISHLLEEINKLRTENRRKLEHLDDVYAKEQNLLNQSLNEMKRINSQLKRELTDVRAELEDKEKQFALQKDLMRDELNLQKQANARLNAKNQTLQTYIKGLEDDLKQERNQNVDVIQDTNVTRRQIIQEREKVRGELEIVKQKEIDQMRNIFNIELNKLKNENNNLLHKLRDKTDQYEKLLKDFKDFEDKHADKLGAKLSRAEDIAKRQATLECEINLTKNIVNAINLRKGNSLVQ